VYKTHNCLTDKAVTLPQSLV